MAMWTLPANGFHGGADRTPLQTCCLIWFGPWSGLVIDATGNTTSLIGKGCAISSAALVKLDLLGAHTVHAHVPVLE